MRNTDETEIEEQATTRLILGLVVYRRISVN